MNTKIRRNAIAVDMNKFDITDMYDVAVEEDYADLVQKSVIFK